MAVTTFAAVYVQLAT